MEARKKLKGAWGEMVGAEFICWLPVLVIGLIAESIRQAVTYSDGSLLDTIAFYFLLCPITGPLAVGLAGIYLARIRGGEISVINIFDGFNNYWRSVFLRLSEGIFLLFWILLLIVPGIIKSLSYSMSYFIMRDNPGVRSLQAITKSRQMMKGFKGKLFMLYLSFAGWLLLCLLPVFIGFRQLFSARGFYDSQSVTSVFWLLFAVTCVCVLILSPYVSLAKAAFYENLKACSEKQATDLAAEEEAYEKQRLNSLNPGVWESTETGNPDSRTTEG